MWGLGPLPSGSLWGLEVVKLLMSSDGNKTTWGIMAEGALFSSQTLPLLTLVRVEAEHQGRGYGNTSPLMANRRQRESSPILVGFLSLAFSMWTS